MKRCLPVPIVRPVGDVVLQHVAADIEYSKSVDLAQLGRKGRELVAIDMKHTEAPESLNMLCWQTGQLVAAHIEFDNLAHIGDLPTRDFRNVVVADIQDLNAQKV